MKTHKIIIVAALILSVTVAFGQKNKKADVNEILKTGVLPKIELNDELQKFVVTTDHFNTDIFANFFNKMRIKGEYTRGLENGTVKWNNVTVAMSMTRNSEFPAGAKVDYMENFTYKTSEDMLNSDKFNGFGENSALTKNLIWDMMGIECLAWAAWDNLKLNIPYSAKDFNGKMDLAGKGSFENKDMILVWTGVSEYNGEPSAVIEFRTMNNPLEYSGEEVSMKGRSHYWGTIWVSLVDKQVEHAVLFEDVIMEMLLPGQTSKQIMDATREISYVKVL